MNNNNNNNNFYDIALNQYLLLALHNINKHFYSGVRAFKAAAPSLWNSLLASLRNIDSFQELKRHLKAHFSTVNFCF